MFIHTRRKAAKRFAKFGWQKQTFCGKKRGKAVSQLQSDRLNPKNLDVQRGDFMGHWGVWVSKRHPDTLLAKTMNQRLAQHTIQLISDYMYVTM